MVLIAVVPRRPGRRRRRGAAPTPTPPPRASASPTSRAAGAVAPNTDGSACLANFFDVDQDPANGCEVRSDGLNGTTFDRLITANLVPADAVDRYPFRVDHDSNPITGILGNPLCDNVLQVTLTAPLGVSMRIEVLDPTDAALESAVSTDGVAATARALPARLLHRRRRSRPGGPGELGGQRPHRRRLHADAQGLVVTAPLARQ